MVKRVLGAGLLAVVAAVGVVAAEVATQDAVTLVVTEPKAGDRVKVTEEETANVVTKFTVAGKTQEKVEKKDSKRVYVDSVITAGEPGKKPVKLTRKYETAETTTDGKVEKSPLTGKTVLIEKKGEKYEFAYEGGGEVTGKALAEVSQGFINKGDRDPKLMMPGKPVKPGETWAIEAKKLFADSGDEMEMDAAKAKVTGKLVKAYSKDGHGYGVIEFTVTAPIKGLGPKSPLMVKEGSTMTVVTTGDGVIDGSEPNGVTKTDTTVKILGSTMGVDLEVTAEVRATKKQETLPKK